MRCPVLSTCKLEKPGATSRLTSSWLLLASIAAHGALKLGDKFSQVCVVRVAVAVVFHEVQGAAEKNN